MATIARSTTSSARRLARATAAVVAGFTLGGIPAAPLDAATTDTVCEGSGATSSMVCWDHVHTLAQTDPLAASQGAPWATIAYSAHSHTLTQAEDTSGAQGAPYATLTYSDHLHSNPTDGAPGYYTSTQTWTAVNHWHAATHEHGPVNHSHSVQVEKQDLIYQQLYHRNGWVKCNTMTSSGCTSWGTYLTADDITEWWYNKASVCYGWYGACGHGSRVVSGYTYFWSTYTTTNVGHPLGDTQNPVAGTQQYGFIGNYTTTSVTYKHYCNPPAGTYNEYNSAQCHLHSLATDGAPGTNHLHSAPADGAPGYYATTQTWVPVNHVHETRTPANHTHETWTYPVHRHIINAGDNCTLEAEASRGVCPS